MRLLDLASRTGPAECFLRRVASVSVRYENATATEAEAVDRCEMALRVLRGGRIGIWGGSFLFNHAALADCVARAEANAKCGPRAVTLLVEDSSRHPALASPALPDPRELATLGQRFLGELRIKRPHYLWSGGLSAVSRTARIVNSRGLEAWSTWSEYRWRLRCRGAANNAPVDRLLDVRFGEWDEGTRALKARIDAEFPDSEDLRSVPAELPITLSPPIVGVVCHTILSQELPETPALNRSVTIWDDPEQSYQGSDDEGLPLVPVPLVESGKIRGSWSTVGMTTRPTGRAARNAIDSSPVPTALGLRWHSGGDAPPNMSVLLTELAGISLQPGGVIHGAASEGILLQNGRPIHRCPGRVIHIRVAEVLGDGLCGVSQERFATGRHRLPRLTVEL